MLSVDEYKVQCQALTYAIRFKHVCFSLPVLSFDNVKGNIYFLKLIKLIVTFY